MNNTSSSPIELFPEVIPATVERQIAPHKLGGVKLLGFGWPARLDRHPIDRTRLITKQAPSINRRSGGGNA